MPSGTLTKVSIVTALCLWIITTEHAPAAVSFRTVALSGEQAPGAEPGATFINFSYSPILNSSGHTAFSAYLTDDGGVNYHGIYGEVGGVLQQIAREGEQAPNADPGVTLSGFSVYAINDSGHVAFNAGLTGPGVSVGNDEAAYTTASGTTVQITREGQQVPGADPGVLFGSNSYNIRLNDLDHHVFFSYLRGTDVTFGNRDGLFTYHQGAPALLARGGQQAPDADPGVNFYSIHSSPVINAVGQIAFLSTLTGTDVDDANNHGIYRYSDGALSQVVRSGQVVTDGTYNMLIGEILTSPSINAAGELVFLADQSGADGDPGNHAGIFQETETGFVLLAREGQQAHGEEPGVLYRSFNGNNYYSPVWNDAGQLAFKAFLQGAGVTQDNDSGIYAGTGDSITRIVREGDQAPGAAPGVRFMDFYAGQDFANPALNGQGRIAFRTRLTGDSVDSSNNTAIYVFSITEQPCLIVRSGDLFDVNSDPATEDLRTIADMSLIANDGNTGGGASAFNDAGQLAFRLTFTDGTSGIFVANLGIPGDLDGDGFVGINDLNLILTNWNQTVPPGDALADTNGDGYIGIADLNTVLGNWNAGTPPTLPGPGTGIPGASIPEPAAGVIVLAGLMCLNRRAV